MRPCRRPRNFFLNSSPKNNRSRRFLLFIMVVISGARQCWAAMLLAVAAVSACPLLADSPPFTPQPAPHLNISSLRRIEARDTAEVKTGGPRIKVARGNQIFQFKRSDGTRVTVIDGKRSEANRNNSKFAASLWSTDDGQTWAWREGPSDDAANFGPGTASEEAAVQFRDNGEILSIAATSLGMKRNIPGNEDFFRERPNLVNIRERHYLNQRRSMDGWVTAKREGAPLDTPNAVSLTGDDGASSPGFLMHHGILELPNGDLIGTIYGNNREDQSEDNRSAGYPPSFGMFKTRVMVVRSSDRGRTWGRERMVATRWMSGRDGGESAATSGNMRVPAVTQEGFNEADLVIAPNGDILCLMRSGGRISTPTAPIYSTPLYQSRSTDLGETWSDPVQIAPLGVNPNAIALENGVLVASYSRPGGWIMFSTDNGLTWKGHRHLTNSDAYTGLLAIGKDEFTVYYAADGGVFGETFRVTLAASSRAPKAP